MTDRRRQSRVAGADSARQSRWTSPSTRCVWATGPGRSGLQQNSTGGPQSLASGPPRSRSRVLVRTAVFRRMGMFGLPASSGSSSSTPPSGRARPFRFARVRRPGMTNTDVRFGTHPGDRTRIRSALSSASSEHGLKRPAFRFDHFFVLPDSAAYSSLRWTWKP